MWTPNHINDPYLFIKVIYKCFKKSIFYINTILHSQRNVISFIIKLKKMKIVEVNSTVTVNYTGKLHDGSVFDSSLTEGREPLSATLGQGALISGFEKGLLGMKEGDRKTIEILSEEAYGMVREDLVVEVPKDRVPENVTEGQMLQTMTPQGPMNVLVKEVHESHVIIDGNHPLAGKDLIFDLELISVE
jgi:FKBP-type peptidyl-prolyl cis-trans isomerase SlpA